MNNIYYITGNAYAGKSTMVKKLSDKYSGIACKENYHESLMDDIDINEYPFLSYTKNLQDWHDFIRRTPDEYEYWVDGVSLECEELELIILQKLCENNKDKKIFVDTNISLKTLHSISDKDHVLIMLADPNISVNQFFNRPDKEKQFLYKLIMEEPDPNYALANFKKCLERINSKERYDEFLNSGFNVIIRDDSRSVEETMLLVEKSFCLL